ncbi:MAG: hypothetical protein RIF41_28035, partial [Polyangiaceae bacterium]
MTTIDEQVAGPQRHGRPRRRLAPAQPLALHHHREQLLERERQAIFGEDTALVGLATEHVDDGVGQLDL